MPAKRGISIGDYPLSGIVRRVRRQADVYGLTAPPETFRRNRAARDFQRRRSRWEVRVKALRHVPPPRRPFGWKKGDEWRPDPPDEVA